MKNARLINTAIGMSLFPIAVYFLWTGGGWRLLLGIFLWTWANNAAIGSAIRSN